MPNDIRPNDLTVPIETIPLKTEIWLGIVVAFSAALFVVTIFDCL